MEYVTRTELHYIYFHALIHRNSIRLQEKFSEILGYMKSKTGVLMTRCKTVYVSLFWFLCMAVCTKVSEVKKIYGMSTVKTIYPPILVS